MSVILKAENISKQYRLGTVGAGTLSDDFKRWWYNIRGKEDPFLKVGAVNERNSFANEDYVWALKDINFEVKQGEVLGIIGKNGAGKSTLLKLLSRVTSPTTGSIKTRGRIASLLEVGTGFHGELTGRENIFMNGAVLGMSKTEIRNKLDEIIAFSGCEKYIDTPVKRYSSGMTVRLGFAVAAHLEPEILVVDEVLAVGDAEFQKKAIGKMQDLSTGEGRTVLFVSHNMGSVKALTNRSLLLTDGIISLIGSTDKVIENYLARDLSQIKIYDFDKPIRNSKSVRFKNVKFLNDRKSEITYLISGEKVCIEFTIINNSTKKLTGCSVGIGFFSINDNLMIALKNDIVGRKYDFNPGINICYCEIDKFPLSKGTYKYNIILNHYSENLDWIKEVGLLDVENGDFFKNGKIPASSSQTVLIEHNWY